MKFSYKLCMAIVALAIVTTISAVSLFYYYAKKEIIPHELSLLEQSALHIGERFLDEIKNAELQVQALSVTPPIQGIIRARRNNGVDPYDGSPEKLWQERLQTIFAGHLASNPNYLQIRYIGVANGGKEIVRVDRKVRGGAVRICPEDELAQKGEREYFQEALNVAPGSNYISRIELNREQGEIEVPHLPTIRLATVVYEDIAKPFGIVIINVDLRELFHKASTVPVVQGQVYLMNEYGDFLKHPDPDMSFGFEFDRPGLAYQAFSSLDFNQLGTHSARVIDEGEESFGVGYGRVILPGGRPFDVILAVPYSRIIASLSNVRKAGVIVAALTTLLAIALSIFFARKISRPIADMVGVMESHEYDRQIRFPKFGTSEFSTLASSIEKMDLAIKRQAEDLKNEARERLVTEARSEARSLFLANMSHEIRTPMNGVVSMAELLNQTELDDEQRRYTRVLKSSADLLLTVIDDILDFSKIEAGKLMIESVEMEPVVLVEEVVSLLNPKANEKNLKLSAWVDPKLPDCVLGDPVRVRQILINLVGNAIKFTKSGHVRIRAERVADAGAGCVINFSVEDTGIGIEPKRLESIFESFAQSDSSTTRKYGGTGLGLTISKQLVELMDGRMQVQSEWGHGSKFSFQLPVVEVAASRARGVRYGDIDEPAMKELEGKRILVGEDNEVNQFVVQKVLEKLHCDFTIVSDGQSVLRAVQAGEYDAILMDCNMPVMDGFESTRAIRKLGSPYSELPIVALTASALEDDEIRSHKAGMNAHLPKPVRIKQLATTLARLCK